MRASRSMMAGSCVTRMHGDSGVLLICRRRPLRKNCGLSAPIRSKLTPRILWTQTRSRRARIKALLLDQSFLRGVGNIYADESLWRAKIHPARLGASLKSEQAKMLHRVLREILQKAIVMRGSSISDFLDADGEPGEYQRHHRAYGREGERCYRCGAIIRRTIVAGRSSYFCPKCQPSPRGCPVLALPRRFAKPVSQ